MRGESNAAVPAWDGHSLAELLALDAMPDGSFRNRVGDANAHGRAYGGQLLGQALMAAARTVPAGRGVTALQFLFLQGARWDEAIELQVTPLQDGKRFVSRHVRGTQSGGRCVFDTQLSFAVPIEAPEHASPPGFDAGEPESLPDIATLPPAWSDTVRQAFGYVLGVRGVMEFRFAAPPPHLALTQPEPRLRFWLRLKTPLPDHPHLHAAAFAYLSDWWLNYAAIGAHQASALASGGLYVASLNHAIWFHRPVHADAWLHFDCTSPAAALGRGLAVARVHDRAGQLVASATQECLMAPRG